MTEPLNQQSYSKRLLEFFKEFSENYDVTSAPEKNDKISVKFLDAAVKATLEQFDDLKDQTTLTEDTLNPFSQSEPDKEIGQDHSNYFIFTSNLRKIIYQETKSQNLGDGRFYGGVVITTRHRASTSEGIYDFLIK